MNAFYSTLSTLIGGLAIAAFTIVAVPGVPATLVFCATLGVIATIYALSVRNRPINDNAIAAAIVLGGLALWIAFDLYARSSQAVWQVLALSGTTFVSYLLIEVVKHFPAGLSEEQSLDAALNRDGNFRALFSPHSALPLLTEPELV